MNEHLGLKPMLVKTAALRTRIEDPTYEAIQWVRQAVGAHSDSYVIREVVAREVRRKTEVLPPPGFRHVSWRPEPWLHEALLALAEKTGSSIQHVTTALLSIGLERELRLWRDRVTDSRNGKGKRKDDAVRQAEGGNNNG